MNKKPMFMGCTVTKNKKHSVCLTNFRILLILSHVCGLEEDIYIYINVFVLTRKVRHENFLELIKIYIYMHT